MHLAEQSIHGPWHIDATGLSDQSINQSINQSRKCRLSPIKKTLKIFYVHRI